MTPAYYRSHFKLEYANMALASGIPCVETLSFQLSLHHLDEKRSRQTPFSFSLSEPFLDFSGKPRSHPKRSRSLPNPVASKHKEIYSQARDENQNNAVHREVLGKVQRSVVIEKVGFRAYSRNTCTTTKAKRLTSPLRKYADTNRHKESEEETSDEELSAVAKIFRERENPTTHLSEFFTPHKFSGVAGFSGGHAQPRVRKRVSDENELSGYSSKRARPTVNFDKMLSSAVGVKVAFEESFFKPIADSELEDS